MKFTNFYDDIPPGGFLPVRMEVKNMSTEKREWRLHSTHTLGAARTFQYFTKVEVPAGETRSFDLLLPLVSDYDVGGRYSQVEIFVSGYGFLNGSASDSGSGRSGSSTPYLGLGKELAVKEWGQLRENLQKNASSRELDGTELDTDHLPADWRGLAGFQIIIFTEAEWRAISAPAAGALRDWVAQGGRLIIWHEGAAAAADLPARGVYGAGRIEHWRNDGKFLDRCIKALLAQGDTQDREYKWYTWEWPMAMEVGSPEPPRMLIMIFVMLFAIIIGPVNFLVFAPPGQRHRLFWTTPAISVAASLIMALYITTREGFGGRGSRFEVMLSLPTEHKAALWQEQVSRTGVLTSTAFTNAEPILPVSLNLRKRPGISFRSERMDAYALNDNTWSGNWFRSRATQAQIFTLVSSSRGRLEISAGASGAPQAVSSFERPLAEAWYVDDAGTVWQTKDLAPGEKRELTKSDNTAFEHWWRQAIHPAGNITRRRAESFRTDDTRGKFFASCATTPQPINSLTAIRWKDKGGLIIGYPQK